MPNNSTAEEQKKGSNIGFPWSSNVRERSRADGNLPEKEWMTAGSDLGCRRSTETKKTKTAGLCLSQPAVVDVKDGAPEEKLSLEVCSAGGGNKREGKQVLTAL